MGTPFAYASEFLFGLAPSGVYLAIIVANYAVRSYRTFSPLPYGGLFSVALSVGSHPPGITWHFAHGARTFLPTINEATV